MESRTSDDWEAISAAILEYYGRGHYVAPCGKKDLKDELGPGIDDKVNEMVSPPDHLVAEWDSQPVVHALDLYGTWLRDRYPNLSEAAIMLLKQSYGHASWRDGRARL
jgi:hypothetical protein